MKQTTIAAVALLFGYGNAFSFLFDGSHPAMKADAKEARALKKVPFNAREQHVSTSGKHKFVAPTEESTRGPCPGLNAMANHGYLPHNGRGTIEQFSQACQDVYGMAPTLALFLSTFGAIMDGDLTSWSVGGKPHTGISGAHGNYESDSSIIRGDLNQYGNSADLNWFQFKQFYDLQPNPKTANYNMDVMKTYRRTRFDQSIHGNPDFFFGPFSGIEVTAAGFSFTYRFFGNKSAEYPEGYLDKNVLKNFYAIYGPEDKLYWKPGWERIPNDWYKRNKHDKYSAASLQEDILYMAQNTPEAVTVGCNVAGTNSYDIIDTGEMTNGAYTKESVAQNPLCFSMAYVKARALGDLGLAADALGKLLPTIDAIMEELGGCSDISDLNLTKLKGCPGFADYGGPKGKIAPGAIQYGKKKGSRK